MFLFSNYDLNFDRNWNDKCKFFCPVTVVISAFSNSRGCVGDKNSLIDPYFEKHMLNMLYISKLSDAE